MQKALAFLEQHVQWLALGLAAAFLLFCVYEYVFIPPAVTTIGSRKDVTPAVVDDMIKDGPMREIDRSLKDNGGLAIVVPELVKPWQTAMSAPSGPAIAHDPFGARYARTGPTTPGAITQGIATINALPTLPKALPLAVTSGLSVVSPPAIQGAKNGATAQPASAQTMDLLWSTASFTIPAKDLQEAFDKVMAGKNLAGLQLTTNILWVELQRQRGTVGSGGTPVFPDGDQGVETVPVPKLLQGDLKGLPEPSASIPEKDSYSKLAEDNVERVTRPRFFDVKAGSPWAAPTAAGPASPATAPTAAPGGVAAVPPVNPVPLQANPGALGAAAGGNGRSVGQIIPGAITADILVWANDDSVQPGAVYRYRVVYHMKNPVLGLTVIGAPNIVDVLDVKSPPSDWTGPVTIPQTTKFWFAFIRGNAANADVFHWENGTWKKAPAVVTPGDKIADSSWTVIDVHGGNSGAREREKYVLLANDAGEVLRRYPGTDHSDEEYKSLQAESNPAAVGAPIDNSSMRGIGRPAPASMAPGQRQMRGG